VRIYTIIVLRNCINAWLKSPGHKENIVGNFTHFGISIRENTETGKKYYTNIFAKYNFSSCFELKAVFPKSQSFDSL
jgi:hypothetical protein